jgi:hypothetical protein
MSRTGLIFGLTGFILFAALLAWNCYVGYLDGLPT